ncbi:MAG: phosphatase PAP2 family protein [Gemmatimonadaceae bacterium]
MAPSMLLRAVPAALVAAALLVAPVGAQSAAIWTGGTAAVALAASGDQQLDAFARSHRTASLDAAARTLGTIGEAHNIIPVLAASALVTRFAAPRPVADAALRIGLSYAAADGVESVLKPLVGRHRPGDGHGAWRFAALRNDEQWHSFPSAHTVHVFSIAAALADESRSRWVSVPAYGVAALVGVQRVYTGAHWGSDVVASTVLAVGVASATDHVLRRRGLPYVLRPETVRHDAAADGTRDARGGVATRVRVEVTTTGIMVGWSF